MLIFASLCGFAPLLGNHVFLCDSLVSVSCHFFPFSASLCLFSACMFALYALFHITSLFVQPCNVSNGNILNPDSDLNWSCHPLLHCNFPLTTTRELFFKAQFNPSGATICMYVKPPRFPAVNHGAFVS